MKKNFYLLFVSIFLIFSFCGGSKVTTQKDVIDFVDTKEDRVEVDLEVIEIEEVKPECNKNEDCDDNNPCTDDECVNGKCVYTNNTNDCDLDGNKCTIDKCKDGKCEFVKLNCWAKTYGGIYWDEAYSIQQTSDGGYIVAGTTQSFGAGNWDFWILKLNSDGEVKWQKLYGNLMEGGGEARSIQQTSDGGYIVAGSVWFFGDGDFFVLKLNNEGDVEWQKVYGMSSKEDWAYSIQQTSDGGYIVAGTTAGIFDPFSNDRDFWVLKLNSDGGVKWQKTYGGSESEEAYSIQQTSDGGYIVAGKASSFGAGNWDFWVLKLNSDGGVKWQKTYGGSQWDEANSIQQTSDGGYIVAGTTLSFGAGYDDFWVLKLNSDGGVKWQKTYGTSAGSEISYSIQQTSDGGYILAGTITSFGSEDNFWVVKLNSDGYVIWQKKYGDSYTETAYSIQETSDGGYIVAGTTWSFGAGGPDFWVLKLDPYGNIDFNPASKVYTYDTNATVTSPVDLYSESSTNISGEDTSATITNTSITPKNTSAKIKTQAP